MKPLSGAVVERKYTFSGIYGELLAGFLGHFCLPSRDFSEETISSLYFDTRELEHYQEKRNGDFQRTKLRLRWYEPSARNGDLSPENLTPCYLELKVKVGGTRMKRRIPIPISPERLEPRTLEKEEFPDIVSRGSELGYRTPGIMVPVVLIRYERSRYIDPGTGSGIALDGNLRCSWANDRLFTLTSPFQSDYGVLEVKTSNGVQPIWLDDLPVVFRGEGFSKYEHCIRLLENQ